VDQPSRADVILVLAGETDHRPERGLDLLRRGYAQRLVLDVPRGKIYRWDEPELAQEYVSTLPQASVISVCAINGLSTKEETRDAGGCLAQWRPRSVLLVTSDYHTRRAFSVFRHQLPQYRFSMAAAYDPQEFGVRWWQHREWAKVNFYEWGRFIWWEAVDRWK